jgi:hypothetical protein
MRDIFILNEIWAQDKMYGMVTYKGCQKRGGQRRFGNGPHMEGGEEDDHEGPGPIT